MEPKSLLYSTFILLGSFISSVSQVLLKKEASVPHSSLITEYLNPRVIIAYGLFFCATLLSIIAYKEVPLSFGPVLEATSYFYVTFFGIKFFGEKINGKKAIALLLIIVGIVVYAFL